MSLPIKIVPLFSLTFFCLLKMYFNTLPGLPEFSKRDDCNPFVYCSGTFSNAEILQVERV